VILSRHALHDLDERTLSIIAALLSVERVIVPLAPLHERVESERALRPGGEDYPSPALFIHGERLVAAATLDLELPVPADELVVARVQREQHLHATLCIGSQHHNVAILPSADIDPRTLARNELVVGAQPDLDRRIIIGTRHGRRVCSGPDRRRRDER
jgi:hypothetical protein